MKISLITYHYSSNPGAIMQTYALTRFLRECGYVVNLIDIRHVEYDLRTISEGSNILVRLVKSMVFPRRMKRMFKNFYPTLTKHYYNLDELKADPPQSDCYIVGSDQVWNYKIARDRVLAYFLDFGDENIRRISYASSFGLQQWETGKYATTEDVQRCLDRFNAISVREEVGQNIMKETFHKEAKLVLDPTLLFDSYPEISGTIKNNNEICCYKLNKTKDFFDNIGFIKEKLGLPAVLINHNYPVKGLKYCFNPSVNRWMRRIAGAKFVITDSFHGVAFSIIFRKQFVAILNKDGLNSRIINLMKLMHLENRMYESLEEMRKDDCWMQPIDYSKVEPYLIKMRKDSINYLTDALNTEK